jgi:hypothetical protein
VHRCYLGAYLRGVLRHSASAQGHEGPTDRDGEGRA